MSNFCNYSTGVDAEDLEEPLCTLQLWIAVLQSIYLFCAVVISASGNLFVLYLVAKYRQLRYRSVIVSLSVVVIDLLLVPTYQLPALISVAAREWLFRQVGCIAIGFAGTYLVLVRWLAMATISLDRFCYIFFPFSYIRWNKIFLAFLTLSTWLVPVGLLVASLFGFGGYAFHSGSMTCFVECNNDTVCAYYYLGMFSVQVLLGACMPAILYFIMLCYSFYFRRKTAVQAKTLQSINSISVAAPPSVTSRWSPKDTKAIVTFLVVFVTQVVTTLPIYATAILRRTSTELYADVPLWVHMIVFDIFIAASYLDPLVIMRNYDFRNAIKKTCSCLKHQVKERRGSISSHLTCVVSSNSSGS